MNAKRNSKRTARKQDEVTLTPKAHQMMIGQVETLEHLLWRKLLATMTPEMREMLYTHDELLDVATELASGNPIYFARIQPAIDQAETILTGLK